MTEDAKPTLEAWIEQFIEYLDGEADVAPNLGDLEPHQRVEAKRQAFAVSELWGRDAKPSDAPSAIAAAFGFDRLDEQVAIDGPRLKAARKAAGLAVSELARELTRLGWSISGAEVGEIESGKRPDVPGTAIPLLASRLNLSAGDFARTATAKVDQLLSLDRVRSQIEAAAQRLGRPFEDISALLRPQLAGAHFREHDSQEDDLVEIVQMFLDGIE